jgi:nitrite reductase/ring-hydroxylating ferredoxin subunit
MKHSLCTLADVPESGTRKVDFFGREALVYRHGGEIKAALSVCPHLSGPLELKDGELVCPWHGARFDAGSGKCLRGPADAVSKAMFLPTRFEDGTLTYIWGE